MVPTGGPRNGLGAPPSSGTAMPTYSWPLMQFGTGGKQLPACDEVRLFTLLRAADSVDYFFQSFAESISAETPEARSRMFERN